eukprot:TRINITY_DN784_c2_g1_i1.p1 TRINITY_DN784_c2_g1~~TRINITY_DN784_c2_g1_i1.p1  ORF type:complete len:220 (+),score=84.24 TRINITY_DN784_c2_g1_i1:187-846(+)
MSLGSAILACPNEMQPKIVLHYFDIAGGAEPIRLALAIGGVVFEDRRIAFDDWEEVAQDMPLSQVPVLEVNGVKFTQSLAIARYAAELANLTPRNDPLLDLRLNEVMYILQDLSFGIGRTVHMPEGDERTTLRQRWLATEYPTYMMRIEHAVTYFPNQIYMVDLFLYSRVNWWSCGVIEGIPRECVVPYKNVLKRVALVDSHPKVKEWNRKHVPAKAST